MYKRHFIPANNFWPNQEEYSNYFSLGSSVMKAFVKQGNVATLQNFDLLYFCLTDDIFDWPFNDFTTNSAIFVMHGFSDASV